MEDIALDEAETRGEGTLNTGSRLNEGGKEDGSHMSQWLIRPNQNVGNTLESN